MFDGSVVNAHSLPHWCRTKELNLLICYLFIINSVKLQSLCFMIRAISKYFFNSRLGVNLVNPIHSCRLFQVDST